MRIVLTVVSGPLCGLSRTFAPAPRRIRIGRSQRLNLEFVLRNDSWQDKGISKEHCELEIDPPVCRIRDLPSASRVQNCLRINGEPALLAELRSGDLIRLTRDTTLRIKIELEAYELPTVEVPSRKAEVSEVSFFKHFEPLDCLVCTEPPPLDGEVCASCQTRLAREPEHNCIPGFLLLRVLGKGGMGKVWLAKDCRTQQLKAVKIVHSEQGTTSEQMARFRKEIQYLARLFHRNIVNAEPYQTSRQGGDVLYFVMEYVPGINCSELLRARGPLDVALAVRILLEVLAGLEYAHAMDTIHRDVKPANILFVENPWTVKLADFGLAYHARESQVSRLTQEDQIGGTLPFLPPEQAGRGLRGATPASDQYGAAATLYTLLTRCYVHDLPSQILDQIKMILERPAVPIRTRRPDLSPRLAAVIDRALERKPENRFASVGEFRRALRPFSR